MAIFQIDNKKFAKITKNAKKHDKKCRNKNNIFKKINSNKIQKNGTKIKNKSNNI